ncbi:broad-complex core protein isoforms 1/2/3/4/5 isoform X2 [Contarinia nasturtii]|uniref:broad-complex core protein isoforms 1/2/3/4/5 isoform X2 n=1 Tax=Contarinia nasturtii TaxID=265458 RepID=UPI0012D3A8B1|nr:broad-complex core protein isoforms 1/2/3/4/5 isoform X2 [Contarinia nasturtii]
MGSEHYCLRWNNHQSNLLGVFSQLLQDESLVDVTLACSEGASIRAHKVVLSACSSYFQSLFLDHPSRHPIVILKDVRFAELRTLIEFMYKGEVNVQYCQLSALLKTAESLKVKGLAEMTNQSSALREPEREQDRLRPPTSSPQNLDATATTTTTNSSLKRLRCSPSPPRHHQPQQQSPLQIHRISPISERHHGSGESPPISSYPRKLNRERERDYNPETGADDHSQPLKLRRKGQHHDDNKPSDYTSSIDGRRSRTPDDIDEMDEDDDGMSNDLNETGINMTINSSNSMNSVPPIRKSSSPTQPSNVNSSSNQMQQPPPNSSASSLITSMIQVGNGNGSSATGNGTSSGSGSATTTSTCTSTSSGLIATSSGITSPMLSDPTLSTEPIAGPSGLGPVQSHPLSLKKEVDWDRSDDKSTGDSISDYRGHVHDSMEDNDLRSSLPSLLHMSPGLSKSLSAPPTPPFGYPLSALGIGLFDADPSRLLSILHHQTLLAEEALRYRGILPSKESSSSSPNPLSSAYFRMNPTFDLLFKGQEQLLKQANSYKNLNRFTFNAQDRRQSLSRQQSPQIEITLSKKSSQSPSPSMKKTEETVQNLSMTVNDEDIPDDDDELNAAAKIPLDEILGKSSFLKDSLRFNCNETTSSDCSSIEEETKCVVCNANFPSVWLLEQHAALQHANLGPMDEKPFICEQCGQSYRYRSAYVKHREQNHRARLPADKLFTCDVCGMQFRYLKSFKKHRLNHALERLHGKFERRFGQTLGDNRKERDSTAVSSNNETNNNEMVTSSNELTEEMTDITFAIKTEEEDDEEPDNVAHSPIVNNDNDMNTPTNLSMANTILSNVIKAKFDNADKQTHIPERPISRGENFTLKQPTRFMPHLHNPNSSLNLHFQQQPSVVASPQQPLHQMHHLRHNEPETSTAIPSTSTINSLINAERIPSNQMLGLNAQEASILNFLRVDAAEKQRDRSRFACPFCGKCVRSKENLKLHVRKHTGERPFVCLFCGRAFGGKSDLTRHLRIHTGERPYHCESCGKCFARADYLSKHLTTHVHNSTPR